MTESPATKGTLSFFQVASDDELSDSDFSENEEAVKSEEVGPEKQGSSVLPSPLCVLADAKTPEFVTSHLSSDLKWDKMVKKAPYIAPKEFKPWENDLPAFESKSNVKDSKPDIALVKQIPSSMARPVEVKPTPVEPKKKEIVDHAISWSKMYKDDVEDRRAYKRPRGEDEDEELRGFCHTDLDAKKVAFHSKNNQSTTHRDKEKRKRNLGQANREKMFVEDEKRVLRQEFAENF